MFFNTELATCYQKSLLVPVVPIFNKKNRDNFVWSRFFGPSPTIITLDDKEIISLPLKFNKEINLLNISARDDSELAATLDNNIVIRSFAYKIGHNHCAILTNVDIYKFKEPENGISLKYELDEKFETCFKVDSIPFLEAYCNTVSETVELSATIKGSCRLDTGLIELNVSDVKCHCGDEDLTPHVEFLGYVVEATKIVTK